VLELIGSETVSVSNLRNSWFDVDSAIDRAA
jgi:hypothetical protein